MKTREREAWDKIRRKGMYRYALVNGALSYGFPMFIVMFFLMNKPVGNGDILLQALVWFMAGLVYGLVMWAINERRFRMS